MVGGLTIHLPVANFLRFIWAKNYENWLRVGKVIAKKAVCSFLAHPVYIGRLRDRTDRMIDRPRPGDAYPQNQSQICICRGNRGKFTPQMNDHLINVHETAVGVDYISQRHRLLGRCLLSFTTDRTQETPLSPKT